MKSVTITDAINNFGEMISMTGSAVPVALTGNSRIAACLMPADGREERTAKYAADPDALLIAYATGKITRRELQETTDLWYGDILAAMGERGLELPLYDTAQHYNAQQKALYDRLFKKK